jgi:hypothetical protein
MDTALQISGYLFRAVKNLKNIHQSLSFRAIIMLKFGIEV